MKRALKILSMLIVVAFCLVSPADMYAAKVESPDRYDQWARQAYKDKNWERMKAVLEEGLKHYPDISPLNELAGAYYFHLGDYDTARFYLYKAIEANDGNVQAKQLMVDVEDRTRNYSAAICYVNELLEVNPYWKGLWLRKIELYRKQHNDIQADKLLKRLRQIYPNDTVIINNYTRRMGDLFEQHHERDNRAGMISNLKELTDNNLANEYQYMLLCNLYLQQGDTESALSVLGEGLAHFPGDAEMVAKKANILAGANRFGEAIIFIDEQIQSFPSRGDFRSVRGKIQEEYARFQMMSEPYTLYGKIYGDQHSNEALDYLLKTAFNRGYDMDALYYIGEAKKRRGPTPQLMFMEYQVHKRINNFAEARGILQNLYRVHPNNYDVAHEWARLKMDEAANQISNHNYEEAIAALQEVNPRTVEADVAQAIYNRMYNCYVQLEQWDKAVAILDSMQMVVPNTPGYVSKRAAAMAGEGLEREAMAFVLDSLRRMDSTMATELDTLKRVALVAAYEDIAIPYIKRLIEGGAMRAANGEVIQLLRVNPASEQGLHYAITVSGSLGQDSIHDEYVEHARRLFPDDLSFLLRQANTYARDGKYNAALNLVRVPLDSLPANRDLVNSFSANSELYALQLLKKHRNDSAMAVVDSALIYDANNRQLLYTKGLIYEAKHRYDSAYIYQSKLHPEMNEVDDYRSHMRGLRAHATVNTIGLEYQRARYAEADVITSVATAMYERRTPDNTYTGTVNYAGRSGPTDGNDPDLQAPGGVGVQLLAAWSHQFRHEWTGKITAGWASRYFPKIYVQLAATKEWKHDWTFDAALTYRLVPTYDKVFKFVPNEPEPPGAWVFDKWRSGQMSLWALGLGATKGLDPFTVEGHVDLMLMRSHFYFNLVGRGRYFPLTNKRTSIMAMASVGTAPEASMIDDAMPGTFSRLNTSVGVGFTYLVHPNINLGMIGIWSTFYNQNARRVGDQYNYWDYTEYNYRNLYNILAQMYIYF